MWLNFIVNTYSFMTEHEKNTEQKILDAAEDVFLHKGMSGARMQEIADKAGINKALLHYYYRTKDKLFEKVFEKAFKIFIPKVTGMMASDIPVIEKIKFFVDNYMDLLTRHPFIPAFLISELNRNPQILVSLFEKNVQLTRNDIIKNFDKQIQTEVKAGILKPVDARNLMINIVSMCIFPIVGRPIIQGVLFENDKKIYNKFLEQRKESIKEFIVNSIKA